ncbi:MAG: 4-alpha-glucanotransferase [Ignavibacteria bacterium]|nr:4-alpha-glucanotransferase [Ignavibacteria bacterium]
MDYSFLNYSRISDKWKKFGTQRRAGVVVPLFSVYSDKSCGIGEIPDLKLIADWCEITGLEIIQLLPLNDMGSDFSPYNCITSFALDLIYLRISDLVNVKSDIQRINESIKKKHPRKFGRVDYTVKTTKTEHLKKLFEQNFNPDDTDYNNFIKSNSDWLKDYATFKILGNKHSSTSWEKWKLKEENDFETLHNNEINFIYWTQWQLYRQMKEVKNYINSKGIILMGDIPFLVSRNSADVWAHKNYFRLDLSAGAPPDMYFAEGQKWGMPPYNWDEIAKDGFSYLKSKLKYAENFYDAYRIDHFIGFFRVWTSPINEYGSKGSFLPYEEHIWEQHGRYIIDVMINTTSMLPCAEDLGTVPECSYRVLQEYGIPGIDFQRYLKRDFRFIKPHEYRMNSVAVISTHDSSFWVNWWKYEAGTIDENLFELLCEKYFPDKKEIKFLRKILFLKSLYGRLRWKDEITTEELRKIFSSTQELADKISWLFLESFREKEKFLEYLEFHDMDDIDALTERNLIKINQSHSIFSIQLIQEYLCLDKRLAGKISRYSYRINSPGKINKINWRITIPVSLEKLLTMDINEKLRNILQLTNRLNKPHA